MSIKLASTDSGDRNQWSKTYHRAGRVGPQTVDVVVEIEYRYQFVEGA